MDSFEVEEFTLAPDDYWNRIGGLENAWRITWVRLASGRVIHFPEDSLHNTFETKLLAERVLGMFIAGHESENLN